MEYAPLTAVSDYGDRRLAFRDGRTTTRRSWLVRPLASHGHPLAKWPSWFTRLAILFLACRGAHFSARTREWVLPAGIMHVGSMHSAWSLVLLIRFAVYAPLGWDRE